MFDLDAAVAEAPKTPKLTDGTRATIERGLSQYDQGNWKAAVRHLADAVNAIAEKHNIHAYSNEDDDPLDALVRLRITV